MSTTMASTDFDSLRAALHESPGFSRLGAPERAELMSGLDRLVGFAESAPATGLDPGMATGLVRGLSTPNPAATSADDARPDLAPDTSDPSTIHNASAISKAPEALADLQDKVDFPAFVGHLVKGVFHSIIQSSVSQMKAYQELVKSVVMQVGDYATTKIDDGEANNYLMERFAGMLQPGQNGSLTRTPGVDDARWQQKLKSFGVDPDSDPMAAQNELRSQAKIKLAAEKQKMLATMVLMGIDRIVVTNGSINASVVFNVAGTTTGDAAMTTTTAGKSIHSATTDRVGGISGSSGNPAALVSSATSGNPNDLLAGAVNSAGDVQIGLSTWKTDAKSTNDEVAHLKAKTQGSVKINFKSDTFPLSRFNPAALESAEHLAHPAPGARDHLQSASAKPATT